MEISKDHPRYRSLVTREHMAEMVREGIVAPTGLIAHGRGEAFDYLMGERTTTEARGAERAAVALVAGGEEAGHHRQRERRCVWPPKAWRTWPGLTSSKVEVNLFHRSEERVEKVC